MIFTDQTDYCKKGMNALTAKVKFTASVDEDGEEIAFNDETVYDTVAGDSFGIMRVTLYDHRGHSNEFTWDDEPTLVNLAGAGLDPTDGIDCIVTIRSDKGLIKDGSIFGVFTERMEGYATMEL
jgi:hypothetical protein